EWREPAIIGRALGVVGERPIAADADADGREPSAADHGLEQDARDLREQAIRENVVDVAGSALDFRATARDCGHQVISVYESDPVNFGQATLDLAQLESDDPSQGFVSNGEI